MSSNSYEISFSVRPKLLVGIYTYEMDVVLTGERGYNIMLWGNCGGSGYTASTKYKYWSWNYQNKVAQNMMLRAVTFTEELVKGLVLRVPF